MEDQATRIGQLEAEAMLRAKRIHRLEGQLLAAERQVELLERQLGALAASRVFVASTDAPAGFVSPALGPLTDDVYNREKWNGDKPPNRTAREHTHAPYKCTCGVTHVHTFCPGCQRLRPGT